MRIEELREIFSEDGLYTVRVPELGLVVLKPGRESMQVFHNPRVLVEPEPKSMRGLPSGIVPVRQPLAEDKSLLPFFSNERVVRAAGVLVCGIMVLLWPVIKRNSLHNA
ncbi:hypothetical protein H6S13_14585 [Escherichia coli]|nr:hypothetical protein H6S13_14585 [Escherichia coli]